VIAATLRARLGVPVIAIEPPVKPAAAGSRSRVIGVLATQGTLASERFAELVVAHAAGCRVVPEPCPDLVELVERGTVDGAAAEAQVRPHIEPLVAAGADRIVLGCTHFHFLRGAIENVAGPGVEIIDPAGAVARELHRRLALSRQLSPGPGAGLRILVSRLNARSATIVRQLCPLAHEVEDLPAAYCEAPAGF
jgi:glutamate racemase